MENSSNLQHKNHLSSSSAGGAERHSFSIYDASAGSGKTYNLVKEYLKIILTSPKNDAYRNILAITFTNKAVHEMKSRIVGSLSEFAKDEPSPKALSLMHDLVKDTAEWETKLSLIQIKTKAQQIIKHIIHNYAAFDISTIDKFTHKVIRAFAHDLNLPMTFEVTLDTENLLIEAVDALIAQAGEDETLTNLLVDFTMEKTDDDKSWDISREILETGKLVLNENHRNEIVSFHDKNITEFVEIKKKLKVLCKELEQENQKFAQQLLDLIEQKGIDVKSFSRGTFPNHLTSIKEGKFNPNNKMFHDSNDVSINKTAKDRAIIEAVLPEMIAQLSIVYENFGKRDFYSAFLKNITPLSLLNTVSNELAKIQAEQNVLSIAEFNAIIHREIQNQPAPFIYERLGERYRHFFIDEFQDTSEMQWQNLIPLIDNALSGQDDYGNKGTLMIVGDPKQSIYRWRGGKAEQFIDLSKDWNPFNNPDKNLVHLDKNYRSFAEIINFNNAFFKLLAAQFEHADYKDLYENHSHQKTNDKIGGYVSISFLPETEEQDNDEEIVSKDELYVQATLDTIEKAIAQGFEYKDIVVLTRKRGQGVLVANYLTENKIPLLSSETLMIQNATEVRFVIHLLQYLNNNSDAEAKAHFLYFLAQHNQKSIPTHDFILKGMELKNENDFEAWLASFDIFFSFQDIRKKSLYEAVERIVSQLIYTSKESVLEGDALGTAYLQYFLDIVLERDVRNQAGIADFLIFWKKNAAKFSIPSPEGNNAVRIMTIHKSKGLEFPVVIFPFAEEDYAKKPKDKLWLDANDAQLGLPKVLVDNNKAVEGFGAEAKLIYDQKKQEELLDNINVLYVALTRAEEQLYIISSMNLNSKGEAKENNMAAFFVDYCKKYADFDVAHLVYQWGNPTKISATQKHEDTTRTIPVVKEALHFKNIKIAQREALMWGTHQQESIAYGNVIHEILSFVKTNNDLEFALEKGIEEGLIHLGQKDLVSKTLQEIVYHQELIPFFSEGNVVMNEQTILQKEGKTVKPDRMVITPQNQMLLLDYKTGAHQPKYQKQLELYQEAIELMGYSVVQKALVYIGETIKVVPF
ncbi:ATP-dependent helicase [Flavobacterium sp. UMI-01]|nr:ATP-dependent helicase [Flavobacterium sp. UMI-01]